jgi:hypothetical protein
MLPNADIAHLREFELDLYVATHVAAVKLTCREQVAVIFRTCQFADYK